MKFLLRSMFGDIGFLGVVLKDEGHDVRLHTSEEAAKDVLRGLVERSRSMKPERGEIVLFDHSGRGRDGEVYRGMGHKVIGGNPFDNTLELRRGKAIKLAEDVGLEVPETHRFKTFGESLAFLERCEDAEEWFFKAEGNKSVALTQGGTAEGLARFLVWAKSTPAVKRDVDEFILQKKVDGAEVSTEGWFDGKRFVLPYNGTLEEKHLMDGALGPRTGCQSNVVWAYPNGVDDVLPDVTVALFQEALEEAHFVGPFDVNAIVDKHGTPYFLELSPRVGFDAFQALVRLLEPGTVGEQLAAFANGELDRWDIREDKLAFTLRVSIPPYPVESLSEAERVKGMPVDPLVLERDRIFPDDIMLDSDDLPVCAGRDGSLLVITAVGNDLDELRDEVLAVAEELDIPAKQYRSRPLESAEERFRGLKAAGVLPETPPLGERTRDRDDERDDDEEDGDGDDEEEQAPVVVDDTPPRR